MIEVFKTNLDGLLRLRPRVFSDPRGHFLEPFNQAAFEKATGITAPFVQDNESCSKAGVLRGLHLQASPHGQAKLARVVKGAVLDVCVDLRPGSATFGEYFSVRLDSVDRDMLYIPAGMAHGFLALEDDTIFAYKCSAYYAPAAEHTLIWNDPDLSIQWGVKVPLMSAKDLAGSSFASRAWEK